MSQITFLDQDYDWKKMSLYEFVQENNLPFLWADFFERKEILLLLKTISDQIDTESKGCTIYPPINLVFRTFSLPLEKIRVVIVGMDPYHDGAAVGLCFSVLPGRNTNPSLNNIYAELKNSGFNPSLNGNLEHWLKQGCLLLNSALTVEKANPKSHVHIWYDFTEKLITYISENKEGVAWLLMGKDAQAFIPTINPNKKHKLFLTSHPSPYSAYTQGRGYPAFIGSNIFKEINIYLKEKGSKEIIW